MLFNSYQFLFGFFPLVLIIFFTVRQLGEEAKLITMLLASIVFYAWWDFRFILLLGGSILMNFTIGRTLAGVSKHPASQQGGWILALGMALNLVILGIFK